MQNVLNVLNAKLHVAGEDRNVRNEYKKLNTDQDRVTFTLNLMSKYDIIPKATGMPKNAKESEKLREKGNKIFTKDIFDNETYINALKLYTESIAFAPYPSQQLALAYANRSAVLFQLGMHLECTQDIDRALALNYPDHLKVKLYIRKTESLVILANSSIQDSLKEAQHWFDKISLTNVNRNKLQIKLDALYNKIDTNMPTVKSKEAEAPLPTIVSYNNEVPCASDALAIKYNKQYGRHVVATRNIRPGEIIVIEKPYSEMLIQEITQTHCSNCLNVCWANIPCNYCTYAMYCSETCKDIEWKKCHDVECAVFPALLEYELANLDFFSMRLAVLAVKEAGSISELRNMLKEIDKCDDPRTRGFSQDGKLHSNRYIGLYSLITNTEKRSVSDLFMRSMDTAFILYFIATRTTMFGTKLEEDLNALAKNDDITFFASLIMRHQQIIPCNVHSVDEVRRFELIERGVVALPFLSLINHSCDPNIMRHSISNHVIIYTICPIKKGEQILDNYGQHCAVTLKAIRQEKLFKQYYFMCDCIACHDDWPLYHELKSFEILVKKEEDKAKIREALKEFHNYIFTVTKGDVPDKSYLIKELTMMIQVLHDCAPMPCVEMNNVVETLKQLYIFNKNSFELPKISSQK